MRENPVVGAPVKDVIHKRPLDYEDSWSKDWFICVFGLTIKLSITLVKIWKVRVVKEVGPLRPHPWCSTSAIFLRMNRELNHPRLRFFLSHNHPAWHQFLSVFVHSLDTFPLHQERSEIGCWPV